MVEDITGESIIGPDMVGVVWWSTKEWDGAYGMCGLKGTISPVFRIVKRKGTQKYSVTHIQFNSIASITLTTSIFYIYCLTKNYYYYDPTAIITLTMLSCIQIFWALVKGN